MTLDLATLKPILPLGARVLFLCLNAATPWCPNHTEKLTLSQSHHTGLHVHVFCPPGMPSSHLLGSHLNEFNTSIMNSNFISSMRFHSSLLPSELTPPSFVPKVTITDLAPYSCHCELEEGRAHVVWLPFYH